MLGTVPKKPADQLDYDIDFGRWLPVDDVILSGVGVVSPDGELVVDSVRIDGIMVKVWLSGGVDGSTYTVTVTVSTEGGRIKEVDFKVRMRDC